MPRYDYKCAGCENMIEVKAPITRLLPCRIECTNCSKEMERVIYPPGLAFKGSGWTPKHYGGT